jgi:hypothetical protein
LKPFAGFGAAVTVVRRLVRKRAHHSDSISLAAKKKGERRGRARICCESVPRGSRAGGPVVLIDLQEGDA